MQTHGRTPGADALESTGTHRLVLPLIAAAAHLVANDPPTVEVKSPGRHAAIKQRFQSYIDYKLWAEKVRGDWTPGSGSKR